eukprot:TRINITY_DN2189_c0_g2_i1.p1 TRINITY_DN2189_c0_g2~~TRINITY_DN2189_c0_g2_i1.p1  ORF type:complete len:680 (+),score=222.73 TRINITY_DN2189_c0_g2_i1:197-2041(+)
MSIITDICESQNNFGLRQDKGEFAFQINTPKRTYYLYANGENVMEYWIKGLKELVSKVQDGGCNATLEYEGVPEQMKDQFKIQPKTGQLFVKLMKCRGLQLSKASGTTGVYCLLTLDKQQIKTELIEDFEDDEIELNEAFTFDITNGDNKDGKLVVTIWAQDLSQIGGKFIGQIIVPISALLHGMPIDKEIQLTGRNRESVRGTLHVKMNFQFVEQEKVTKDDFIKLKLIGQGNFGKVMQVRKRDTGRVYAMKILRKDTIIAADAVKHTLSETNVLRRIDHPFIVNLKYSFQSEDKLYMIMDYLSGGELFYHLSNVDKFSEDRARFYAAEIILALGYLHKTGVVYRDLKPENLLLDVTGHVCLTDFGLVKENIHHGDVTTTFCGSPEYLAPEILQGKAYGKEVDWWALGTFLYEMLEGLPPFYDEDIYEMNRKILTYPLSFDPNSFSPEAKSLLRGLLQRDPKLRLGSGKNDAEELKSHPFFKNIDWDKLLKKGYEPSFKPHLSNAEDVRYFDPEFTSRTPKESYVDTTLTDSKQNLFAGFSYASTSSFEQLKKQRSLRKNSQTTPALFEDCSTSSLTSPNANYEIQFTPDDDYEFELANHASSSAIKINNNNN